MTTTDLTPWLEPLAKYVSMDRLVRRVEAAVKFLPDAEVVKAVLPSYAIGNDGTTLTQLVLVSSNLVCDIKLSTPDDGAEFDFAPMRSIRDYRYRGWHHEIKVDDVVQASFELGEITWVHDFGHSHTTVLTYAGSASGREAWIEQVIDAVPLTVVVALSLIHI